MTKQAEDIEIAPETIEAGVEAWYTYDGRFEDPDAVVARIWRAMWTAQQRQALMPVSKCVDKSPGY